MIAKEFIHSQNLTYSLHLFKASSGVFTWVN